VLLVEQHEALLSPAYLMITFLVTVGMWPSFPSYLNLMHPS